MLREMLQFIAQRMMELDVEGRCGASYGERGVPRELRDGYRDRLWEMRADPIDCAYPSCAKPSVSLALPWRTAEKAFAAVIQDTYVQGVSTRSVDERVKAMGMTSLSKSQVSRLGAEIDERVNAFLNRPAEGDWPYVRIDARAT